MGHRWSVVARVQLGGKCVNYAESLGEANESIREIKRTWFRVLCEVADVEYGLRIRQMQLCKIGLIDNRLRIVSHMYAYIKTHIKT